MKIMEYDLELRTESCWDFKSLEKIKIYQT